jgi:CRISPR system Cascade subunit CasC
MTREERQSVVRTFVEATIKAIPGARKNTMNGNTLPDYVLGVVREKGHPIQLVNAYESPIRSRQGHAVEAIRRLNTEYTDLKETWGIEGTAKVTIKKSLRSQMGKDSNENTTDAKITDELEVVSLNDLIKEVVEHVI